MGAYDNLDIAGAIGSNTFVHVGLETDICVAHSALRLQAAGKQVAVVSDATFSTGASHQAGLDRLAAAGIELLTAKGVLYDWTRSMSEIHTLYEAHPELRSVPSGIVL